MSSPVEFVPDKIYCLKCRSHQNLKPLSLKKDLMTIKTKSGKTHFRSTWIAICAVCEKSVRRFAKSEEPVEEKKAEVPLPVPVPAPL
jgi:hypothetical protein